MSNNNADVAAYKAAVANFKLANKSLMSGSLGLKNNGRSDVLRIALIGCGAVVIKSHVPAILDMSGVTVAAVVDGACVTICMRV